MKHKLAENLSRLRKEKGWSQKETAQKLGISQALLSHYEKGIRECGLDFLLTASEVFDCSVDSLLSNKVPSANTKSDIDNISADLQMFPLFAKSKEDVINTLNLLYSITARIGNPEICGDFNKIIHSQIYLLIRMLEGRYFNNKNFKNDMILSVTATKSKNDNAFLSFLTKMQQENININLEKGRIIAEYPTTSASFYKIINEFEE